MHLTKAGSMSKPPDKSGALFRKAVEDQKAMQVLMGSDESPLWAVGFHAQQAVEKAMKAVLCSMRIAYPMTHDLELIVGVLRSNRIVPPPDADELVTLNPYGSILRYDIQTDALGEQPSEEWMRDVVQRVIGWATRLLSPGLG
jgi:HEPN domain-containing protein